MKEVFYFGCIGQLGHYLFKAGYGSVDARAYIHRYPNNNVSFLQFIDGIYTPAKTKEQGKYQVTQIGDNCIISWHDYTMDKRPGSNSNVIGIGYNNPEELLTDAINLFPSVFNRQPRPIPIH